MNTAKKPISMPLVSPEKIARDNFSSFVQSVAFQLTLSRRMIGLLQVVRDYGYPHLGRGSTEEDWGSYKNANQCITLDNGSHQFVTFIRTLERRGLIIFDHTDYGKRQHGQRSVTLSRAGQLVCDLLVESGLMAPESSGAQKRASK